MTVSERGTSELQWHRGASRRVRQHATVENEKVRA
jgi:hypothetical protein